jgi:hypothetical protein
MGVAAEPGSTATHNQGDHKREACPCEGMMSKEILFTVVVFNSLVLFIPVAMFLLYKRPRLWHYLLALFLGLMIGWIDLRSVEVQPTVLLLLVFGLFLGFAQPRHAWRWAVILAVWIPLGGLVALVAGLRTPAPAEPGVAGSFIAFIPALIGSYCGAFVNWASTRLPKQINSAS